MEDEKCCGTCEYHEKDDNGDWVCCNPKSEYSADWTEYGDKCDEWEER